MALDLNTQYYREFQDPDTLDTMRISFIPGFVDYFVGVMPSVELPSNFILDSSIVSSGYDNDLPLGRQLANEFEIEIDIKGLYDRGAIAWTELIDRIVQGTSTQQSNSGTINFVLGDYIFLPNVWKLENITQSRIEFLGVQENVPSMVYSPRQTEPLKVKALGIESFVYGYVTNQMLRDNEASFRTSHSYTVPYLHYLDYISHGAAIEIIWYTDFKNGRDETGTTLRLHPYYYSVAEMTEYIMNYLAEQVLRAVLRNASATLGVTGTYLISHKIYKQSELQTNLRTAELNTSTEIYQMPFILNEGGKLVIENDRHSGLFYDFDIGWSANPNIWDLLINLCEQGLCRLTADYNGADELTMIFEQPFQASSGSITNFEIESAELEKGGAYADNFSITRTGTYSDEVSEIKMTGTKTDNGDSYDFTAMFEIIGNSSKFSILRANYAAQAQDVPAMRGLYYKYISLFKKNSMKLVHPRILLDIGDSITYEQDANRFNFLPTTLSKNQMSSAYNLRYLATVTHQAYLAYAFLLRKILKNRKQALITLTVPTSAISNVDIGKSYLFNTDLILDGLDSGLEQKCILTNVKSDYSTGKSEIILFLRGENGV